jgi:hypothetical protein
VVTLREARDRFRARHRLDPANDDAPLFRVPLGPIALVFPNPGLLPIHDLHHVALDAPPDFWGEVEVSALELRAGPPNAMVAILCLGALGLALVADPRRAFAAWHRHRGARSFYRSGRTLDELLAEPLALARARLG